MPERRIPGSHKALAIHNENPGLRLVNNQLQSTSLPLVLNTKFTFLTEQRTEPADERIDVGDQAPDFVRLISARGAELPAGIDLKTVKFVGNRGDRTRNE